MADMMEALKQKDAEIVRFLRLTEAMSREEVARLFVSWLGIANAKAVNDFLDDNGCPNDEP